MRSSDFHSLFKRLILVVSVPAWLALAGCAATPVDTASSVKQTAPPPEAPRATEEPELTLNLPDRSQPDFIEDGDRDENFLARGLDALTAGDHIEAVTYFQRYARLESSPLADWESGIAIAYDSLMAQSPFYDLQAANKSYRALQKKSVDARRANPQVLMMQEVLATFSKLQAEIDGLQADKAQLKEDLAKREEALKRLRELTLGQ